MIIPPKKRWELKPNIPSDTVSDLCSALGIKPVLAKILIQRGVSTYQDAELFFRPALSQLHDPFLMKDMDLAVNRINEATGKGEKVLIYGDYDVDGTTAVSMVYSFLKNIYPNVDYYIPDRYKEGYGISTNGIDWAKENDFKLIIALDCGIKSVEHISYANSKGIDFIICDHHLPGEKLPEAIAVLDPKRSDCTYPFDELSGCGIGFKLLQAFASKNGIDEQQVYNYLDLVAVSTCSDIVPIIGENRILVHFGLKQINTAPCPGLKALAEIALKKPDEITVNEVVFYLGPRINAAGRMDDARHAVRLLISDSVEEATEKSKLVHSKNQERQEFDSTITDEALAIIENNIHLKNKKTTVLYQPDWHKGVIGIVASRLIETHYRPTIVFTKSGDKIAGSARSVLDFDVYEAISKCSDLLEQYGGHKYAAGLTLAPENLDKFIEKFENVVSATITDELLTQRIIIDTEIELADIDAKFYRIISQMAPFGPHNMRPVFCARNVFCERKANALSDGKHIKMAIRQPNSANYDCIGFALGEFAEYITPGKTFDICFTIEENNWNGKSTLQLNLKDILIP